MVSLLDIGSTPIRSTIIEKTPVCLYTGVFFCVILISIFPTCLRPKACEKGADRHNRRYSPLNPNPLKVSIEKTQTKV